MKSKNISQTLDVITGDGSPQPLNTTNNNVWAVPYSGHEEVNKTMGKNLAEALLSAQKEISFVAKEADNPFFKSKYASLGNVIDACKTQLNKSGVLVAQPTGKDQWGHYVETLLVHAESGEQLSSRMYLELGSRQDMQALGAATSYARRYSLQSLVFLPAEDSDAEGAMDRSGMSTKPSYYKSTSSTKTSTVPTPVPKNGFKPVPKNETGDGWE